MKTTDNINYTLTGCRIRVLNINEPIRSTDFIRPYYEDPMASESGGWDCTYKPDNWQGPMWHKVDQEIPYWIGKTYKEYMDFIEIDYIKDEIVRIEKYDNECNYK